MQKKTQKSLKGLNEAALLGNLQVVEGSVASYRAYRAVDLIIQIA